MFIKKITYNILNFAKNETVLTIAAILAVISAFFVKPDARYIEYVDFRTLALLFCLMAVMAGLRKTEVFSRLAEGMLSRVHGIKGVMFILVMLCFFTSMLITNDVALITFVPFTFTVLNMLGGSNKRRLIVPIVVMQTIAANLGSMLTPIGNPQNLYLQGVSGMGAADFIMLMLPYALISFLILSAWILVRGGNGVEQVSFAVIRRAALDRKRIAVYTAAFIICLLTVARVLDYRITLIAVTALVAAADHTIFADVDYTLLLTFIAFFIFIGNMGRIPSFESFLQSVIFGRECVTGVLSSQLISNVPAALLLSGFIDNYEPLIVGVNLGGLGTIIASMASLISFKLVGREDKRLRGKYMVYFTVSNVLFLAALMAVYFILENF